MIYIVPEGFILTRQWRDTPTGIELDVWLTSQTGPVRLHIPQQRAICFVRQSDVEHIQTLLQKSPLNGPSVTINALSLRTWHNELVSGVYCLQQRQLKDLRQLLQQHQIPVWEADIKPAERFFMERFVTAGLSFSEQGLSIHPEGYQQVSTAGIRPAEVMPVLNVVSLDIETSFDAKELYSIAVFNASEQCVFMVGAASVNTDPEPWIVFCPTAKACLQAFLAWVEQVDPDIFIGWHVVQFDFWVLETLCRRWGVPFRIGRARQLPYWREDSERERRYLQIPGRVVLDGIELLRMAFYQFDRFSLQHVASELLGRGKLLEHDDRAGSISELFTTDKNALAQYNLRDCQLVWDIFEHTELLAFAVARAQITGLPLDRAGGSVASFEYAYLPRMHRLGYVAPNLGEVRTDVVSPGGYVMDSRPGLYKHVLVLDFKSLYPSIIRTFTIDPVAFWAAQHQQMAESETIQGFNGAYFSRDTFVLPDLIKDLWSAREQAKRDKNVPLSQAIKIIMNSFYGVLGSTGCRFFDPRVCSSITLRGHDIIQQSRNWIQTEGYQVIYGDTDSLFVWLDRECTDENAHEIGAGLAAGLNQWWKTQLQVQFSITSALEIEFETHYSRFFMPTIRSSEKGSKKRYAGIIQRNNKAELVFKGLETVRTDWTALAKTFQQDLYAMVFNEQPFVDYINKTVADVLAGQRDSELVYRKRLRRPLADYHKSNPPHVKAARKLAEVSGQSLGRGDWVDYLVTVNGPEPVAISESVIDYQHYIDKQLMPIADSILQFVGYSFDAITNQQIVLL